MFRWICILSHIKCRNVIFNYIWNPKQIRMLQKPCYNRHVPDIWCTSIEIVFTSENCLRSKWSWLMWHIFIDLIERLRIAVERRSPKPDMVPRSRLQDTENELTIRNQVRLFININKSEIKMCYQFAYCRKWWKV